MTRKSGVSAVSKHDHFAALDGLRGVAALAVLVAHASAIIIGNPIFPRKYLAVQFFFMLSGFVVMCAYEKRIKAGMTIKEFYIRRVIRLYPLMVTGALLGALFFSTYDHGFEENASGAIATAFAALGLPYPYAHFSVGHFPVNPPEWSLFFELLAYIAFGALVLHSNVLRLCIIAITSLALYSYITVDYFGHSMPFWMNSFGASASFTVGALLWKFKQADRVRFYPIHFLLLALIILATCAVSSSVSPVMDIVSVAIIFPVVITLGAISSAVPSGPSLNLLGELSYPVYILHWPVVQFVKTILIEAAGPVVTTIVACTASIAVSWIIYLMVDRPLRRILSTRYGNRKLISPVQAS